MSAPDLATLIEPGAFGETAELSAVGLSIAISLKRIADILDGTTVGICATETIFNPQTIQNREVRNSY